MRHLQDLRMLLQHLPDETGLPLVAKSASTVYNFVEFSPVQRHIQVDGAEQLEPLAKSYIREIEEAMHMRGSDPEFVERGPDLVGIVDILEQYIDKFGLDCDIEYIIDELLAVTKGYYYDAGKTVSLT